MQRDWLCPLCGREPRELESVGRDTGKRWAAAFCAHCWSPHAAHPGTQLTGGGVTQAEARGDWNRQVADFWGRLLGGPMRGTVPFR